MTDTPTRDFIFDLDSVESERKDEAVFKAKVNGREIEFINPKDVDWIDLADLGDDPIDFVELCVKDEEDATWLVAQSLPSWKAEKLIEAFTRHYGIGNRRRGGRGNRSASRR
jgi:hypothetical protein